MNEPTLERPSPLTFDLDQWRSDIQTFAEETSFELQQIIAELAGSDVTLFSNSPTTPPLISSPPSSDQSAQSNQRLTSLKEKLAKRITSPNQ